MGGGKGSTSTSTMKPPKEIMEAYKKSLGMAEQATQTPYQQYGGQLVADLNPTQQQGIANVNASQGAALPYIQQGAQYTAQGAQGVTPGLVNQFMSPYLSNVVGATQKNLLESQQQQTSGLRSGAIQAGAFGGDRSGIAQAEMARQQGLAGGQVIGGLLNQGYGQALAGAQNQVQNYFTGGQQMAGLGTAAQGSMLQGAQAQMAAGAQQQATEQTQLQAAYDQFLQRQAYPYQQAQFYANIAQGIGAGAGGTSSTTAPGPNFGSQLLGGLGAIGSIWGASDERLKENIKPVGKTNDGQTIYKYNFKGSPKTEIGLLAQEVEKRTPDAVREFDGYKAVNYDEATKGAENTHGHSTPSGHNSMGGVVAPNMDRQPFASGGLSDMPYADFITTPFGKTWLPTGDTGRHMASGKTLPDFPKPYVDTGLGEAFSNIQAMSPAQLKGLKAGMGKAGTALEDYFDLESYAHGGLIADHYQQGGGVGARHQYATDGMVATLPIEHADLGSVPKAESPETGVIPKAPDVEQVRQRAIGRTQQFEGGRLERDTNGTLTNYGINQAANPDIDVSKLNAEQAAQIMRERYWNTIGGDQLAAQNPDLAHVAHDTSVMAGPGRTKALLKASGGDPVRFMDLRDEFTQRLVAQNPEKYGRFAKSWANRSDALRKDIGAGETAPGLSPPVDAGAGVVGVQPASDKQLTEEHKRNLFERLMGRDFSPEANAGILAASLGMMAGRSPFFGVNVGEGGLAGLKTYYNALGQGRETAKVGSEIGLQQSQAETQRAEAATKLQSLGLNMYTAFANFNVNRSLQGLPSVSMEQFRSMLAGNSIKPADLAPRKVETEAAPGTPSEPAGALPKPAEASPEVQAATPPKEQAEPTSVPPEAAKAVADQTVAQAKEEIGSAGDPNMVGTLAYYQRQAERTTKAMEESPNPESRQALRATLDGIVDRMSKITNGDFYKAAQNAQMDYEPTRSRFMRLAEINSEYQGGRGAETLANFVGLMKSAGLGDLVPENLSNADYSFDDAMKLATQAAIEGAQNSGLLKAPGQALQVESKTQPVPGMAAEARYDLIKRGIASLDYTKDMYENWKTNPDVLGYVEKFRKDPTHKFENYVSSAEKELKKFPPKTSTSGSMGEVSTDVLDKLYAANPNPSEGLVARTKSGKEYVFKDNKWVQVK